MQTKLLINLFNAFNLLASHYHVKAQSTPDIVFENASPNNTWVFNSEYSQNAFCDYDSCHLVLDPGAKQWIAFSGTNGVETITYDVCDTAGKGAVIYGSSLPQCTFYSGAKINVTARANNVTAIGINNAQSVEVNKVQENQTDSDASLQVYNIMVTLLDEPNVSSNKNTQQNNQFFLFLCLILLLPCALLFKYCGHQNKKELLLENKEKEKVGKNCCGFFFGLSSDERIEEEKIRHFDKNVGVSVEYYV